MLRLAAGLVAGLTFSRGRSAPPRVVQLQWRRLLNRSSLKTGLLVGLMFGLVIALVFTIWILPGSASANGTGGRARDRARVRADGRFRIARRVAPDRVISTVDPQARHGRKTPARGFDGYRGTSASTRTAS